jgi:hypothetical protein
MSIDIFYQVICFVPQCHSGTNRLMDSGDICGGGLCKGRAV